MTHARRPAVLVVTVEVAEDDVDELNRWYEEEHRPEKLSQPGYLGLRRFRASDGSPTFLAIYELDYPDAAAGGGGGVEATRRMEEIMATWKRWDRRVWVELQPAPR
jgi:hypothetical protein